MHAYYTLFFIHENRIGGVMVSVLDPSVVDHGFISGVMVSVLDPSVVDHGFEPRSGQSKGYKIGTRSCNLHNCTLIKKK